MLAIGRVYKVFKTDEPDGHRYIGSSGDELKHRLELHQSEARHDRPYKLYVFMDEHRPENFSIITLCEVKNISPDALLALEQKYIDEYDSFNGPLGLNGKNATLECMHGKDRRKCKECKLLGIGGSHLCDLHPDLRKEQCSLCKTGGQWCPCGSGKLKAVCNSDSCTYIGGKTGICVPHKKKKMDCPGCNPCILCMSKKNSPFPHPALNSKHRGSDTHKENVIANNSRIAAELAAAASMASA
jgi:hypothetical protein